MFHSEALVVTDTPQLLVVPGGHANTPTKFGIQLITGEAVEAVYLVSSSSSLTSSGWQVPVGTQWASSLISPGAAPYVVCATGPVTVRFSYEYP